MVMYVRGAAPAAIMKGLLVRVGIDSADGGWNAPMRLASGEFAYVTITDARPLRSGMVRRYDEFVPAVARFGEQLPKELLGTPTHLDPDFDQLPYGDQGQRGRRITTLVAAGNLLAFFTGLRRVDGPVRPLIYALIGLYVIKEIVAASSVPQARWNENATPAAYRAREILSCGRSRRFLAGCVAAFLLVNYAMAYIACATTCSRRGVVWTLRMATSNEACGCPPSTTPQDSTAGFSHKSQRCWRQTTLHERYGT